MKQLFLALSAASVAWFPLEAAELVKDVSHIDVYVTPYYNSKGPSVSVGRFSSGLASANAFTDTDGLVKVVHRVQQQGRKIPDLQTIYPNVTFRSKSEWESANTDLADGMGKLISTLKEKKDDIRCQRIQQGIEEKFSKLTNKDLPGR
jgi:hypothetical protein